MKKPKGLTFNDTIGVIAPGSSTTIENVEKVYKKIIELGFKPKMGKSCYESYGYLAGKDSLRAEDINNMFEDEEVKGILCIRGGYGTPRILELLDYKLIKNNPKVFIGYSDITALHLVINQKCKLVTFHGPMAASNMIENFDDFSKNSLYNCILDDGDFKAEIENPSKEKIEVINKGIAKGEIIGGNLSLIADTIGTPYEIDTKGKILFIEEIGEEEYNIDRMLTQLRLSGKLESANGIILGDFNGNTTLHQVIGDILKPLGKPTIFNLQSGHCKPMLTIPLGIKAKLDANNKKITILEKPIR